MTAVLNVAPDISAVLRSPNKNVAKNNLGVPYDVVLGFDGVLEDSDEDRVRLARNVTYVDPSTVYTLIDANPTATVDVFLYVGTTLLGSLTITSAGAITWTQDDLFGNVNFDAGAIVRAEAPATADATLAGLRITIPFILR